MKNGVILLMLCFITGCGINCIEGSKGVSSTSVSVDVVPTAKVSIIAKEITKDGKKTTQYYKKVHPHWVDTGIRVSEDQKVNLTISGSVNLCPKDSLNPKEIIVPAISCNDGIPDYKYQNESTYFNMKKVCGGAYLKHQKNTWERNLVDQIIFKSDVTKGQKQAKEQQVKQVNQVNQMIFSPDVHTISTFRLNKGDVFRVNLVPRQVKIKSCSSAELKNSGIIYYSDNEIFSDDKCAHPIKAEDICKSGVQSFSIKMGDKSEDCIHFPQGSGGIDRLQGTKVSALVDNRYSPRGNKIFYTSDSKKNWIKAPFVYDARTIKNQKSVDKLKSQCEIIKELNKKDLMGYIKNNGTDTLRYYKELREKKAIELEVTQDTIDVLNNFTTYDINCVCGTICKSNESLTQQGKIPSVLTINGSSNECSVTDNSNQEFKNAKKEDLEKKDWTKQEWNKDVKTEIIAGLTAYFRLFNNRVGKSDKELLHRCFPGDATGFRCIYSIPGKSVKENSIKSNVNYTYELDDPVLLNFGIIGEYNKYKDYSGGYNIHVERMCNFVDGKKLYMYIGNTPPTMLPGSENTTELFVSKKGDTNSASGTATYTINDDNSTKKSGTIYLGVDVRGYEDQFDYRSMPSVESSNKYTVEFAISRWNPNFSQAFVMIRDFLLKILYGLPDNQKTSSISQAMDVIRSTNSKGAVQHIYTNQTTSGRLWRGVQALCTLYIIFTILGYVIGVVKCTKYDLGVRVAKIAVVVGLLSQDSWELFSSHFFSLFVQGVSDLIATFNGELDGDNSFSFLDPTIGVLLTGEVWIRFLTLIVTGPIGWLVFAMIIWAVFVFFLCIIEAVIAYLFTIVAVAFLATLAPIFITFLLFQLTKTLFDSWIKMLVNFSLQPIILFAALAFLNQVMLTVLHDVTGFTVCNQCFLGLSLPTSVAEKGAPPDICVMPLLLPVGYASELSIDDAVRESDSRDGRIGFLGLPFGITSVLVLLITANAMKAFRGMSESISQSISGSIAGIGASLHAATQSLASIVGLDQETQSIIKSAMANRRSTGQSDVNISSRAGTNPVNEGEPLSKDGDGGDNRPVVGDQDKLGGNNVSPDQEVVDSNEGSRVSQGGRYGPVDHSLMDSGRGQVLDTDSSSYRDNTDGNNVSGLGNVADTSDRGVGNPVDDSSSNTSVESSVDSDTQDSDSRAGNSDTESGYDDERQGKSDVEEAEPTTDRYDTTGDQNNVDSSQTHEETGSASDKVSDNNENQDNNEQQGKSDVEEAESTTDRHDATGDQNNVDSSQTHEETGSASDKVSDNNENQDNNEQQGKSDVEEAESTTDRHDTTDVQDSVDSTATHEETGSASDKVSDDNENQDNNEQQGKSDIEEAESTTDRHDTTDVQDSVDSAATHEGSSTTEKVSDDDESRNSSTESDGSSGVGETDNESDRHDTVNSTSADGLGDTTDKVPDDNDKGSSTQENVEQESSTSDGSASESGDGNSDTNSSTSEEDKSGVDENNNVSDSTGDMNSEEGKVSSAVDVSSNESEDVSSKRGKRGINFLDGPQKQRLYMDEYSSVKEKIAGHQSAIDVEEESHERSKVRRRGKKKEE
ncbi:hypothetical protein EDL79_02930 [Ehrlichia ruminantium]|uniref:Type IV secretion system protein n=1 Tax=Ehrlichia ruminantium TaxID=779 RepID=A0AAE6UJK8_EHRRU|nr:type IV secretion system protein [Ehrlichia ruminantium]QGR03506.1 hypothetical protein EDL80_02920 [Ehrlichia ruminantium]QGR04433.1 hypothetical protein EDL79_02930 [Ehrlichia ruminantium]